MNASGAVLIVAGAWLLCQVLGGDALGRLGVTGAGTGPAASGSGGNLAPGGVEGRGTGQLHQLPGGP